MYNRVKSLVADAGNVAAKKLAVAAIMCLALVSSAMAEPPPLVDWAAQATELKTEASPAITAAIGVGIAFLAVAIGYKLLRRFAK